MSHTYANLLYHIVFSTKDRQPLIAPEELRARLYDYLGGIIRGQGGIPLGINGMADHIHILAKLRQDKSVSDVVREVKSASSRWIHESSSGQSKFAWQAGYGVFTVSMSQVERVQQYITNQETHHRKMTFAEEFVLLLQANGIEFSEEYLWK